MPLPFDWPKLTMLDVPHYRQRNTGYCLPACLQMVLEYVGIRRDQAQLARELGVTPKVGVAVSRVTRLAIPNVSIRYQQGEIDDLVAALAREVPPILNVATGQLPYWEEECAHAIVLVGLSDDQQIAYLNDPAFDEPAIACAAAALWLAWDDAFNYHTLVEYKKDY